MLLIKNHNLYNYKMLCLRTEIFLNYIFKYKSKSTKKVSLIKLYQKI